MKTLVGVLLLATVASVGQTHKPKVTVSKLSAHELKQLADSQAMINAAQADLAWAKRSDQSLRDRIILTHGGYLNGPCYVTKESETDCAVVIAVGTRLDDDAEWKGDYLILTPRWEDENWVRTAMQKTTEAK